MPETHRSGRVESPYAVLRWLVLATFVVILNETIMVNAIPRLMVEFDVTARSRPVAVHRVHADDGRRHPGHRLVPAAGHHAAGVRHRDDRLPAPARCCAAVAPVFSVLLAGRVVQAAGTAVMMPLLMTTLMTIVPEHDRGRVMGNVMLAISVAPALGPAVSGVVLQFASWRWLFGLVLPIAAVITVLALRRLDRRRRDPPGPSTGPSVVLAALGFGTLVYGLSQLGAEARARGPARPLVVGGLAVVGAVRARASARCSSATRRCSTCAPSRHRTYAVGVACRRSRSWR